MRVRVQGCAVSAVVAGGAASGFMLRSERDIPEQPAPQLLERLQVLHALPNRFPLPSFRLCSVPPSKQCDARSLELHGTTSIICGRAI